MAATEAAPPTQASEVKESLRLLIDAADVADAAPPTQASEVEPLSTRMAKYRTQMERVIHYKKTRTHIPGLTHTQRRVVNYQLSTHVLSDDKLYYIGGKKRLAQEVITSEDRVREVLHQYHSSEMGGHSGIIATTNKIVLHYYWNNMHFDITEFVKNCAKCQEMKKPQPEPDLLSIINRQTPPRKKKTPRKRKTTPAVNTETTYTQLSAEDRQRQTCAVDQETQTSSDNTKQNKLFLESLLPSLEKLDDVETMQFRIDVEQLVLSYLSQARARTTAAAPAMAPHANPAAFPAAWYHNMDRNHSYN